MLQSAPLKQSGLPSLLFSRMIETRRNGQQEVIR